MLQYTMTKWIILLSTLATSGCSTYIVTSATAWALTGKSIPDHATSKLTLSDCDAVRMAVKQTYYCEVSDPSVTYNRNGY